MSTESAEPLDEATLPAPALLLEESQRRIEVAVHDATRLAWNVTVPIPEAGRARYTFDLELEVPANIAGLVDPWAALQSYGRLDGSDIAGERKSLEEFRRAVVVVSSKLARARDGFARHCALILSAAAPDDSHWRPLKLWLSAASIELANARGSLLRPAAPGDERALADEFLSAQLWTVLTDCGRTLFETRAALENRDRPEAEAFDDIELALGRAVTEELAYRCDAGFALAEPANAAQLERLLARMRWLKKHFEGVLFLEVESYQVLRRLSGWFSALAAMLAYLWFVLWQVTLERHPVAIGSGVVAFALLTAVAYASRERLKETGRNWLAGRVERMFAQRVTRYRLPGKQSHRGGSVVVVSARESFSQSAAQRPDPVHAEHGATRDVTVFRFVHRGFVSKPPAREGQTAGQVRFIYRFDFSAVFSRLHDAVRGFASVDKETGRVVIVDVPRNYDLPFHANLRWSGGGEQVDRILVLNKNGLLRVEDPHG